MKPFRVGIIDGGIDSAAEIISPVVYRKSFAGKVSGYHGTMVAKIIGENPKIHLYDIQILQDGKGSLTSLKRALHLAIDLNLDLINLSLSGPSDVKELVSRILNPRKIIVISCFNKLPPILLRYAESNLPSSITFKGRSWQVTGESFLVANVSRVLCLFKVNNTGY